MKNVLYFGDSIMGQEPNHGYINLLAHHLYTVDPSSRHHFLQVGGNSSQDLLERIENEIATRQNKGIRGIVVSIGIVDAGYKNPQNPEISLETYQTNMQKILSTAQNAAQAVWVPGLTRVNEQLPQPFSPGGKRTYSNKRIETFDQALEGLCIEADIKYILIHHLLLPEDLADGIHPSRKRHIKIFERIKENL